MRILNMLKVGTNVCAAGHEGAKRVRIGGELTMFIPTRTTQTLVKGIRTVVREPAVAVVRDFLGTHHRVTLGTMYLI